MACSDWVGKRRGSLSTNARTDETSLAQPAEKLSDALIGMMHARIVYHEGRVLDVLAICDEMSLALGLRQQTESVSIA